MIALLILVGVSFGSALVVGYAVAGGYLGSFLSTLAVQLAGYSAWCLGEAITNWEKLWDG